MFVQYIYSVVNFPIFGQRKEKDITHDFNYLIAHKIKILK